MDQEALDRFNPRQSYSALSSYRRNEGTVVLEPKIISPFGIVATFALTAIFAHANVVVGVTPTLAFAGFLSLA